MQLKAQGLYTMKPTLCLPQMKRGELDFIRQMNELEVHKAKELGKIEACACSSHCVWREM